MTTSLETLLTLENPEIQKWIKGQEILSERLSNQDYNFIVFSKKGESYQVTRAFILGYDAQQGPKVVVSCDYFGDSAEEAAIEILRVA